MSADPQRRGLLADLTRHLAPLSLDALRIVDEFALGLLQAERERPIELGSMARQIVRFDPREPADLAINAAIHCIGIALLQQDRERTALTADDLQAAAKARADRERRTAGIQIGKPGDNWGGDRIVVDGPGEFEVDQHLTRVSATPEVIALAEQERDRDEDLEVELDFDVSDIHAGSGT